MLTKHIGLYGSMRPSILTDPLTLNFQFWNFTRGQPFRGVRGQIPW